MFQFGKHDPVRPAFGVATGIPGDTLPSAVLLLDGNNREAVGQLLRDGMSEQAVDSFAKTNAPACFGQIGIPYAAYDGALPDNAVAQLWQHQSLLDMADAIVVRRVGVAHFLVEAREGANALILYRGDKANGKGAAALLCFTPPDHPSRYVPVGDTTVFAGADFTPAVTREPEFRHVRDHILRQCSNCAGRAIKLTAG